MNITILGVGDVGTALAPLFAAAGHQVLLASRRSRQELAGHGLAELLSQPNVTAGGVPGSAASADLMLLSVPYGGAEAALAEVGDLTGRIVVDATNFNHGRDGDAADPGPGGTTTVLAERYPQARWVKSFNMLWAGWLRTDARPAERADRAVLLAADDDNAKTIVAHLIKQCGFVPFDTGGLADAASRQLEGTPAWNQRLTAEQAAQLLPDAPGARSPRSPASTSTTA